MDRRLRARVVVGEAQAMGLSVEDLVAAAEPQTERRAAAWSGPNDLPPPRPR